MSGRGVMTSRTSVSPKSTTDRSRRFSSARAVGASVVPTAAAGAAASAPSLAGTLGWPIHPMMSAVKGATTFAMAVNVGRKKFEYAFGRPSHEERRQQLSEADVEREPATEQQSTVDDPRPIGCASRMIASDQQHAAQQSRRYEELDGIVEVGPEPVARAVALRFQAPRQAHQEAERGLDDREEQQPAGQEDEERNHVRIRHSGRARAMRPVGSPARRRRRSSSRRISPESVS